MRKKISLMIVFTLFLCSFGLIPILDVHAVNNQGLEWSVEVGQTLNYTLFAYETMIHPGIPLGQTNLMINITSLPILPDDVDDFLDFRLIYDTHFEMVYENGTRSDYGYPTFMVAPTGNWTLMQSILAPESPYRNDTFFNSPDFWGIYSNDGNSLTAYLFSKTTGILLYFTQIVFSGGYQEFIYRDFEFPDDFKPETDNTPTSEGLYWGVSPGDRFYYSYNIEEDGVEIYDTLQIEIVIDSLPTIPDPFTLSDLQNGYLRTNFRILLENGSYFKDYLPDDLSMYWMIFPIGNQALVSSILEQYLLGFGEEFVETPTSWGFVDTTNPQSSIEKFLLSKTDGVLNWLSQEKDGPKTYLLIREGYTLDLGTTTGTDLTLVLIAGAIGVVMIVAVTVVIRKRT